jgi:hypothetical protein
MKKKSGKIEIKGLEGILSPSHVLMNRKDLIETRQLIGEARIKYTDLTSYAQDMQKEETVAYKLETALNRVEANNNSIYYATKLTREQLSALGIKAELFKISPPSRPDLYSLLAQSKQERDSSSVLGASDNNSLDKYLSLAADYLVASKNMRDTVLKDIPKIIPTVISAFI